MRVRARVSARRFVIDAHDSRNENVTGRKRKAGEEGEKEREKREKNDEEEKKAEREGERAEVNEVHYDLGKYFDYDNSDHTVSTCRALLSFSCFYSFSIAPSFSSSSSSFSSSSSSFCHSSLRPLPSFLRCHRFRRLSPAHPPAIPVRAHAHTCTCTCTRTRTSARISPSSLSLSGAAAEYSKKRVTPVWFVRESPEEEEKEGKEEKEEKEEKEKEEKEVAERGGTMRTAKVNDENEIINHTVNSDRKNNSNINNNNHNHANINNNNNSNNTSNNDVIEGVSDLDYLLSIMAIEEEEFLLSETGGMQQLKVLDSDSLFTFISIIINIIHIIYIIITLNSSSSSSSSSSSLSSSDLTSSSSSSSSSWSLYELFLMRTMSSGLPSQFATTLLHVLLHRDERSHADVFARMNRWMLCVCAFVLLPAVVTHVIPMLFVYIWLVLIFVFSIILCVFLIERCMNAVCGRKVANDYAVYGFYAVRLATLFVIVGIIGTLTGYGVLFYHAVYDDNNKNSNNVITATAYMQVIYDEWNARSTACYIEQTRNEITNQLNMASWFA